MKRIISFTLVAALAVSLAFGAAVSHAGRPSLVPKAHVGHQPQARHTLTDLDMLGTLFSGALTVNNEALAGRSTQDDDEPAQINFVQGKIAFEFVGQATNFAPTPSAPLGSAHQYGFLTMVEESIMSLQAVHTMEPWQSFPPSIQPPPRNPSLTGRCASSTGTAQLRFI